MFSVFYFGAVILMTLLSLLLSGAIQSSACSGGKYVRRILTALVMNGAAQQLVTLI